MPYYAQFDSTQAAATPVIGWYDTGLFDYPNLPDSDSLLLLTQDEWDSRAGTGFGVYNRTLVPYTPPPPILPIPQQAVQAINNGLELNISGALTINATLFPIDPITQSKITAVVTTINATGNFPGGRSDYLMKDLAGAWHQFTLDQYVIVAGAIASYVATLNLIADGNPFGVDALPAPVANIVVS